MDWDMDGDVDMFDDFISLDVMGLLEEQDKDDEDDDDKYSWRNDS